MAHVAARPDGTRWVTTVLRRSAARCCELEFVGRTSVALLHLLLSPSRMRWRSGLNSLRLDGVNALPITGLLTFLIGVVIAYQGPNSCEVRDQYFHRGPGGHLTVAKLLR